MQAYERLEQEFGKWTGAENVVACSSGTAALHLALESLRLAPGSHVIVPDFTMIACARAVTLAGCHPVFADCNYHDLCLSPEAVENAVQSIREESHTGDIAIMAVHIYGRRCDMDRLHTVATRYDAYVVEDLAEAHGIIPHPNTDASCWSFYENKVIAGEEGGAVAFRSTVSAALARSLRCQGFTPEHDFFHVPRGHNYRLANCLAEKILSSLQVVESNYTERRRIERLYDRYLPEEWRMPTRVIPWVYDIRLPDGMQESAVRALNARGIGARHGFKRMTCQEEYRCRGQGLTNAGKASNEIIYLPIRPGITTEEDVSLSTAILLSVTGIPEQWV